MDERRQHDRLEPETEITGCFELKSEITGEFRNYAEFVIKNISVQGFNCLSNFSPHIGRPSQALINYHEEKHDFEVKIIHSHIFKFLDRQDGIFRPGVLYSIGCEFIYGSAAQKKLIREIIKNECAE